MALPKCECDKPITLCDRLNCTQSTFIQNGTQMTPNDKLPKEIVEQIKQEAEKSNMFNGYKIGYQAGATAWAPWKVKYNEAKKLLDEVIRKHESGLLPDRFIYEKIKTFLNEE